MRPNETWKTRSLRVFRIFYRRINLNFSLRCPFGLATICNEACLWTEITGYSGEVRGVITYHFVRPKETDFFTSLIRKGGKNHTLNDFLTTMLTFRLVYFTNYLSTICQWWQIHIVTEQWFMYHETIIFNTIKFAQSSLTHTFRNEIFLMCIFPFISGSLETKNQMVGKKNHLNKRKTKDEHSMQYELVFITFHFPFLTFLLFCF